MITDLLNQALNEAIAKLGLPTTEAKLEHPSDGQFGDWSTNLALQLSKSSTTFSSPKALAEALVEALKENLKNNSAIAEITVAGPGFINFKLSESYWLAELSNLIKTNDPLKQLPQPGQGKKVIVEYSSPNIAKPFTVGHLRSTIIGDAIANLYEAIGWQVFRDNHLGDWGTQFGKLIYAIKTWGNQAEISQAKRPIKELVELYVKFHQEAEAKPELEDHGREWFKKLEAGDAEARQLWQWCIDLSWLEFDKIYSELKVSFTENNGRGYGESFFEDKMTVITKILTDQLPASKLATNGGYYGEGENGAKLVFFKNEALPSLMIVKKDGATLYSTRDLATDYFRLKTYQPDLVINEVGAEQSLYFKQLYAIEEMLGWYQPGQRKHVRHGLYRFKDQKMSTRKGQVIWLEEVIEEAKTQALALSKGNQLSASQVAIGALKWNDLKSEVNRDIIFDWAEILSMKGNSGPYVQYAAVRSASVLAKADLTKLVLPETYQFELEEKLLLTQISRFGETVVKAGQEFAPHHLALFLFELAQKFNAFYNQQPILNAPEASVKAVRLALTQATKQTLVAGLKLLGIETPEEM